MLFQTHKNIWKIRLVTIKGSEWVEGQCGCHTYVPPGMKKQSKVLVSKFQSYGLKKVSNWMSNGLPPTSGEMYKIPFSKSGQEMSLFLQRNK